jgi:hypothetical protein
VSLKMIKEILIHGWFSSLFQPFVVFINKLFPGYWLNSIYWRRNRKSRPGLSECYVLARLILGILWLWRIEIPPTSFMSSCCARVIGGCLALYAMADIFTFTIKWIFVDVKPVEDIKRSLFLSFVNIFEVALFSSIPLILFHCTNMSPWSVVYESLRSIFKIELFRISDHCAYLGKFVIHFQLIVGVLLLLVVIAGLVGSIRTGKNICKDKMAI